MNSRLPAGLAAALLGAALLAGCGGSGEKRPVTVIKETTVQAPPSQPPASGPRAHRALALALASYDASLFSARVPAGWTIEKDDDSSRGFARSQWRDPANSASTVLIDAVPREATSAADKAAAVRAATSRSAGYRELAFRPTTLAGREAYKWVFRVSGDERVDYFLNECDTGVAILGSTAPRSFGVLERTFAAVARSVQASCDSAPGPPVAPQESSPPDQGEGSGPLPPRGPSGADGTYNCDDFDTQQQAQDYFDANGDIDGLDRDGDGVPCETLP